MTPAAIALPFSSLRVDPRLYGRVTPQTLAALRARYHVTQIGRAALVRTPGQGWLVGVWNKDDRPAWADRLDQHHRWLDRRGEPTPLESRREAAWFLERAAHRPGDSAA